MAKISRNAPCPCGSGKKYKKCCLQNDLENAATAKNAEKPMVEKKNEEEQENMGEMYREVQLLDDLSNSVIDLIELKKFDEAEKICQQLLKEYPQQVDGLQRMAMLNEVKGDRVQAIQYYRKTVEFMQQHDGFDPENIEWHEQQADRLEHAQES